ncbi:hypothetical protein [Bradyrhizobium jicamae]|nr:hypothetical protein [Bradyrhizobium jicamae]MBR0939403.1 hypothetical protein [Bradyrhizobium jicamae]
MATLAKPMTDLAASRPVSPLAIVALFSLVGLTISLLLVRYGVDIATGM